MALLARATGGIFFLPNNSYSKLILKYSKAKLYRKQSLKVLAFNQQLCNIRFTHNDLPAAETGKKKYILYDEYISKRRKEAQRSILVEVQSENSCNDVYSYCSQFGKISELFHYTNLGADRNFVLIEYANKESIESVLNATTHLNYDQIIPVQSLLMWFRNSKQHTKNKVRNTDVLVPIHKNCCKPLKNVDIINLLISAKSISHQMLLLYNRTNLNNVESRLRFFTACQIERSFHGLFPNIEVLPYGSSVNGFGKQNCDLDLSLILEKEKSENPTSRLVFQSKTVLMYEKQEIKKLLEIIADVMKVLMPGISNVRKILEARVPILKFDHLLTGVECDLSMTNLSAYYMSEMMYMYGEIDERVRPLVFTVRKWAQCSKLTNTKGIAGPWIRNFSLSAMVIFFLQQKKILPTLNLLKANATKEDVRTADIYIDCTFLRDINKIPKISDSPNVESLENLLFEFFTYYGNFDFETKAISIKEGKPIPKPDYSPLYICNPLETNLNVSKNVNVEELEKIKIAIRSALWRLESNKVEPENWGLINLFFSNGVNKNKIVNTRQQKQKTVDIQALFQNDESYVPNKVKIDYKRKQNKNKTKI